MLILFHGLLHVSRESVYPRKGCKENKEVIHKHEGIWQKCGRSSTIEVPFVKKIIFGRHRQKLWWAMACGPSGTISVQVTSTFHNGNQITLLLFSMDNILQSSMIFTTATILSLVFCGFIVHILTRKLLGKHGKKRLIIPSNWWHRFRSAYMTDLAYKHRT